MSARDAVLRSVRRALDGAPAAPPPVRRAYDVTGRHARGSSAALDLFAERLTDYRATVTRCAPADLARTIAGLLGGARSVVVPPGVPPAWLAEVGCEVRTDVPPLSHAELDATDAVLTGCRVAIAETATIVLDAGPAQGRRALTLLPDRHVCVVRADAVVHTVPEAVAELAAEPWRPLTWISGPSATSDIELVRVEGVHGPRDLRVVVVG